MPRVGGHDNLWMNGLYDSLSVIFVFPLIVYLGASGEVKENISSRISNFLGSISYPIYIIHYPFIYLYMVWEDKNHPTTWASIVAGIIVLTSAISLAYLCEKFYDIPMSKWLTKRFMNNASK